MYSFTLPFHLYDESREKAFDIAVERYRPFSVTRFDSVDVTDCSKSTIALVTFRSECENFARFRLLAFYFLVLHLYQLPFPDSFDNSEFEDDEK